MTWKTVSTGSAFEKNGTFSRAIHDDDWVLVSGTSGFDYHTMTISEDFGEQLRQTWKNIAAALEQAGSHLGEIVSYTIYLTDRKNARLLGQIQKEILSHRPSGTLVCTDLVDERMKVEIQVTARRHAKFESLV